MCKGVTESLNVTTMCAQREGRPSRTPFFALGFVTSRDLQRRADDPAITVPEQAKAVQGVPALKNTSNAQRPTSLFLATVTLARYRN